MNQFERDLRESLKRREPPEGFAEKVLARARATEQRRFKPSLRWVAAAAALVLLVGGVGLFREQRRQAEGERAKMQLMVALRITSSKLRSAQEKVSIIQQRTMGLQLQQ